MKRFAIALTFLISLAVPVFAQSAAPAAVPVAAAESAAIGAAQSAYAAAQQAEQAPLKAVLASEAQQALHAATIAALDQLKAALDNSAAAHAVDTNAMQYSPSSGTWVKPQGGAGGRGGLPVTR